LLAVAPDPTFRHYARPAAGAAVGTPRLRRSGCTRDRRSRASADRPPAGRLMLHRFWCTPVTGCPESNCGQ